LKVNRYVLVQTAVGDYRQSVLEKVTKTLGEKFELFTGSEYFEESTKTRVIAPVIPLVTKNIFLFNRKVLLQPFVIFPAISASHLILEMNPRILNTWIILIVRKILGKKTVLWGHAWPRNGASSNTDKLRNILRQLADHILVYTDTQQNELLSRMPAKSISSAPNALYSKNDMWVEDQHRSNFIYVGRLVATKKIKLLIKAFYGSGLHSKGAILTIVGDGPEFEACKTLIDTLNIGESVLLTGHVSDLNTLRKLYSKSIASVSPGYVGLSITQSFSFGTPMIVSEDENHSPEIEAVRVGFNSEYFTTDSVESLSNVMKSFWINMNSWKAKEKIIIEDCKKRYSTEVMAERILEAFEKCNR
jgi:glycosyltransferase involved in cell wall biosynthesis